MPWRCRNWRRPERWCYAVRARVVTMRGDEVLEDADIVVTANRIAGVGRRESIAIPAGAKVFDVAGTTVVPGFIDTQPHWFEIRRGVLDMQNWSFLANLAYASQPVAIRRPERTTCSLTRTSSRRAR